MLHRVRRETTRYRMGNDRELSEVWRNKEEVCVLAARACRHHQEQ